MKLKNTLSNLILFLGMIGATASIAQAEDSTILPEVGLSQELSTLTQEIDFIYFKQPYQLDLGSELRKVFVGSADAPYQLELVKCEVFHRLADHSLPGTNNQVDCRIKVLLKTEDGHQIPIAGSGAELFNSRSPYDVIREAVSEAVAELISQVRSKVSSE